MDKRARIESADDRDIRGSDLSRDGEVEAAQQEWRKALELDPNYRVARYHLAESYREEGNYDLAEREYRELLRADPNDPDAQRGLAMISEERADLEDEVRGYRETLEAAPEDDEARLDLAWDLIELGRLSEARSELRQLADLTLDESPCWVAIGDAHAEKGEYSAAIDAYKEALEINPDQQDAREGLKRLAPMELQNVPPTATQSWRRKGIMALAAVLLVLFVVTLIGLSTSVLPALGHVAAGLQERRIVLRANRTLTPDEMRTSVDIYDERLMSIGLPMTRIEIQPPDTVVLRLASDAQVTMAVWESSPGDQLLEFVDIGDTAVAEGTIVETSGPDTVVGVGTPTPTFPTSNATGNKVYRTVMTGKDLSSVSLGRDGTSGKPNIGFSLTDQGQAIFADYTAHNVGRYLGIILNHKVIASPVIKGAITCGSGIIEGSFTLEEAQRLVVQLNGRPLPAQFLVVADELVPSFW